MTIFPRTPAELAKAGYIYVKDGICQAAGCGALIHWYKKPTGDWIAIDSICRSPHYLSCASPSQIRKGGKKEPPPEPQMNMFETKPMREPGEED